MKHTYSIIIAISILFISTTGLYADTILLNDGTYLVGKIIEWDSRHIIFKNANGAFAIRKNQLVKLYITGSHDGAGVPTTKDPCANGIVIRSVLLE